MVNAVSDLTSRPSECQRPIDGEHRLRIQTRDASDSELCNGTETTDKGPVYVLPGPAGVKFYPTLSSEASAQCEHKDSGSKYQQGQLCEVSHIGGSSSGTFQQKNSSVDKICKLNYFKTRCSFKSVDNCWVCAKYTLFTNVWH